MQNISTQETREAKRFPENLPPHWQNALRGELEKPYFKKLVQFLGTEYASAKTVYPARENILRAIQLLDLPDVRVVILGQDPYHGKGQAIGLSFAVPNELKIKPPSLLNIFKEVSANFDRPVNTTKSELSSWLSQGVLLLNTVLSVRDGLPLSHRGKGWEIFTDEMIRILNAQPRPIIFMLWGSSAQQKSTMIDNKKHFILSAPHPSPLSAHRGFLGSKHFLRANQILTEKLAQSPIDWTETS